MSQNDLKAIRTNFRKRNKRERLPKLSVTVHIIGVEQNKRQKKVKTPIVINCGEGEQKITWLALTSTNRSCQNKRNLLPKGIFKTGPNAAGDANQDNFLNPKSKIREVLSDGDHVYLCVKSSMKGTPALNPPSCLQDRSQWSIDAFSRPAAKQTANDVVENTVKQNISRKT